MTILDALIKNGDQVLTLKPIFGKSIYFVLILILIAVWISPTRTEVLCSGKDCETNTFFNGPKLDSDLVQTFDIGIRVSPNLSKDYVSDFSNKEEAIGISWNQAQQLLITIPMRYGSSQIFTYATPKDLKVNDIRIRIERSESLFIFINKKIAYSHRYENSPFFVNLLSPVITPVRGGKVLFTSGVIEQTVEKKGNRLPRSISILLVLGLFTFTTVKLLKMMFLGGQRDKEITKTFDKSLFGLVGVSWAVSIFVWVRNPIDTTGALNAGPIAPIGAAFSDFYQLSQVAQFERPYDLGATNYPPTGILLLRLISFYDPNNLSFFPIAGLMLGAIYFLFVSSVKKMKAGIIFLTSFPFIFGIVRGNLDLLAIFLVWISILSWEKGRHSSAAIFLAFAIAIKIWPIVFLLVFFKKKNWLLISLIVLWGSSVTLLSSFVLGYRRANEIINITVSALFDQTSFGTSVFQYSFSFTSVLFFGYLAFMSKNSFNLSQTNVDNALEFVNGAYSSAIIILILIFLTYFFVKAKNLSTEFLILSGIVLLVPTQSFTYRASVVLLYFYLRSEEVQVSFKNRSGNPSKIPISIPVESIFVKKIANWCTIPLFAPTAYYCISGTQFSTASLFQPLCLIVFIGLTIYRDNRGVVGIK